MSNALEGDFTADAGGTHQRRKQRANDRLTPQALVLPKKTKKTRAMFILSKTECFLSFALLFRYVENREPRYELG